MYTVLIEITSDVFLFCHCTSLLQQNVLKPWPWANIDKTQWVLILRGKRCSCIRLILIEACWIVSTQASYQIVRFLPESIIVLTINNCIVRSKILGYQDPRGLIELFLSRNHSHKALCCFFNSGTTVNILTFSFHPKQLDEWHPPRQKGTNFYNNKKAYRCE